MSNWCFSSHRLWMKVSRKLVSVPVTFEERSTSETWAFLMLQRFFQQVIFNFLGLPEAINQNHSNLNHQSANLALLEEGNWEQWRLVDARKCERSVCSCSQIWRATKVPIWGNYQILVTQFRCNHHRVVACKKREIMKRNFLNFWRTLFRLHSTSLVDFFHKWLKLILLDPNGYILATKRRRHKSSFIGSRFQSKK